MLREQPPRDAKQHQGCTQAFEREGDYPGSGEPQAKADHERVPSECEPPLEKPARDCADRLLHTVRPENLQIRACLTEHRTFRSGSNSEFRARDSAVRFTLKNVRRQSGLSVPRSAITGPTLRSRVPPFDNLRDGELLGQPRFPKTLNHQLRV